MFSSLLVLDPLTTLCGAAALLCLVLSPVFKNRGTILFVQLKALVWFTAYFACLDVPVAALANLLGAVQVGAAIFAVENARMRALAYALIGVMIVLTLYLWQGPISALGAVAMILAAVARMQADVFRLRIIYLAGGSAWALHDFLVSAWIGFAADVGTALVGIVALYPALRRAAATAS